ncbi:MAG: chemotaxis protein CheW [Deltaproteobacteria bacterium]|nr:MAG: chemotaxis protein CheW [Deltaproteobacteria bacterium]
MGSNLKKINSLIESCRQLLSNFLTAPYDFYPQIEKLFDSLFVESDKLNLVAFKSSLAELYRDLQIFDETLGKLHYTDPDSLEEAKLFISGGFLDISSYLSDLKKHPDGQELKEKNAQKLTLLKDWMAEFQLSIPQDIPEEVEEANIERFIIFKLGEDNFAINENIIQEILHVNLDDLNAIEDPHFKAMVKYRENQILIWNRGALLGENFQAGNEEVKIILVGSRVGTYLGLEVDKILKIQELDTNLFTSIEDITGPSYQGAIQFLTLFEDSPLFIIGWRTDAFIKDLIPIHLLGDAR